MKIALTIAGSDSSGGAGIQADIKTFQALGVFATSAITAVTAQNTQGVTAVQEISRDVVYDQIRCLYEDMEIDAVKIGMVSNAGIIEVIAEALIELNTAPVVLDPVMISKSGHQLLKQDAREALVQLLFPLADMVTPNIMEAEQLSGLQIGGREEMKESARRLKGFGPKIVVVKGGHFKARQSVDVVYDGEEFWELRALRIDTKNTHGTGCTFSSAIAANLALGLTSREALKKAKKYTTAAIKNSLSIGNGHGPTNHFFAFYR